jgi:uncharacterized surface protein with fasciclin (FAS1) repeats
VLVLAAQPNGVLTIIEPTRNITVSNATRADNLEIAVRVPNLVKCRNLDLSAYVCDALQGIPNALIIPGTIAATAAAIPELSGLIAAVNGSAPQLFQQLDQTPGLTIFAPSMSRFSHSHEYIDDAFFRIIDGDVP